MQNPFPGMNPDLEQPELWHQVHNRIKRAALSNRAELFIHEFQVWVRVSSLNFV